MSLAFAPIDLAAKTGAYHLLKGADDSLHSGHWDRSSAAFTYAGGQKIQPAVTHYATRRTA